MLTRRMVIHGGFWMTLGIGAGATLTFSRQQGAAAQATPTVNPAAAWTFTDFLGRVTTLPAPPARIAAEISTAAALYDMGVQVHSVWGYPANDPEGNAEAWGRLPVDSVVNISTVEDLPDPEKALVAETDLFLFGATELEDPTQYSEDDTPYINLPAIAPIAVWPFLDRVDRTTAALWDLAVALGANPAAPENVAAQEVLDATVAELQAVLAEKPGLTAMFGYPITDEFYVANPALWDDVNYFRSLGLEVIDIDPALAADWWETLSWEQAMKYQPDVIFLATENTAMSLEDVREHPAFKQQPAVKADQVRVWSWYFARSPQGMTRLVQNVLDVVRDAEVLTE